MCLFWEGMHDVASGATHACCGVGCSFRVGVGVEMAANALLVYFF